MRNIFKNIYNLFSKKNYDNISIVCGGQDNELGKYCTLEYNYPKNERI